MTINTVSNNFNFLPISGQAAGYARNNPAAVAEARPASKEQTQQTAQQQEIQQLKDRDREVKAHEQAHLSAAGGLASGSAHFTYVTGPDGQRYASGGDVGIDISEIPNDPQATLRKAETIRRAAMAPAQPSGQDYSVAGRAAAMANKAAMQLAKLGSGSQSTGKHLDTRA